MTHPHSGPCSGQGLFCASAPRLCTLLLCLTLCWLLSPAVALRAAPTEAMLMPAPAGTQQSMIPPVLLTPSAPLLPRLQYFIDHTGTMDVEEVAAPVNASAFQPLQMKGLPRSTGIMWLRFTLAPLPQGVKPGAMLLDMGASVPDGPVLYEPHTNLLTDAVEWREITPSQRDVLLLPEAGNEPLTCYLRLDGLPGLWFEPMLRTPQDAANNWGSLAGTAAVLAMAVVMLLCLLRGLSERGQWRIWTALYVAAALAQAIMGMPAYGSGHITLMEAAAVLSPGVALMLLPHVGRHLLRTKGRSRLLDMQFVLLSLPGAVLALLPLLPGFGWLIRYLALWPLCTLIFVPSAVGGAVMGLGGARRFLLGCLLPPAFVAAGILGLDSGYAANLMASAPLWGTALSALIIAGTGAPRDMAHDDAARGSRKKDSPLPGLDGFGSLSAGNEAGKAAGRKSAEASLSMDGGVINLDQPLDDPNLRLLPPAPGPDSSGSGSSGQGGWSGAGGNVPLGAAPSDEAAWSQDAAPAARFATAAQHAPSGADPCLWENALRPPLERLLREGAALGNCALPPAVRQYAENMLEAAADMAHALDNPGKGLDQSRIGEPRSSFNLQHMVREAHDAVSAAAENAGIGLAWYMPPLLGHMYEGQAQTLRETLSLLLESAVRATSRGAVHLSVRRVPESADPGHLLFTVTDTGTGIPPRNRSTLALARAWELAGTNNCYLNVECAPQGTSISFTLRLKPLEHDSADVEDLRPHVAVVADGAVERQGLAHMVAGVGLSSTEARTMREALELNRENPALLLVAHAPMDGPAEYTMLEQFKQQAAEAGLPFCKALAVTSDDSRWEALADTGYTHALLEPVDKAAFATTVHEILEEAGIAGPDAVPDALQDAGPDAMRDADSRTVPPDAVDTQTDDGQASDDGVHISDGLAGSEAVAPANVLSAGLLLGAKGAVAPSAPLPDLFGTDQTWAAPNDAAPRLPDLTALPQILGLADQLGGNRTALADSPGLTATDNMTASPGTADDTVVSSGGSHAAVLAADAGVLLPHVPPVPEQPVADFDQRLAQEVPDLFGAAAGQERAPEPAPEHAPEFGADSIADTPAQAEMHAGGHDVTDAVPPAELLAADDAAAPSFVEQPADAPEEDTTSDAPGGDAEFIASAGLEGPAWGGEAPSVAEGAANGHETGGSAVPDQEEEPEAPADIAVQPETDAAGTGPDMMQDVADLEAQEEPLETLQTSAPEEQEAPGNPEEPEEVAEPQKEALSVPASAEGTASAEQSLPADDSAAPSFEDTDSVQAPELLVPAEANGGQQDAGEQDDVPAEKESDAPAAVAADSSVPAVGEHAESTGADVPAATTLAAAVSGSGMHAGQPVISVRGRIGEAVLRPVNAPRPDASAEANGGLSGLSGGLSDVLPTEAPGEEKAHHATDMPSGMALSSKDSSEEARKPEGYLDATYPGPVDAVPHEKLDWGDEWVGEPMPVGTPVSSSSPARANDAPLPAPAAGGYVSPSLARPGEWVGEPMPIDRNAIKESRPEPARPVPAASERRAIPWPGDAPAGQSAAAASRSSKPSSSQREMPRTATGRLILKLLGSTADTPPLVENAQEQPRRSTAAARPQGGDTGFRPASAGRNIAEDASIVDFIAGATPPSGGNDPVAGADVSEAGVQVASASSDAYAAPVAPPVQAQRPQQDETLLRLVERLDAAMQDAQRAYKGHNCPAVAEASGRIANESDGFGFRVLARMARCVERAARANDMSALRDLLPELAVAVERNRIALNPHHQGR
ncbi:7TM-DISM domain-containing protein [Desulfovibrio sp.]|uniref:7TM-DISM domain-containing protein n=1 Tax=Desulfovibrio sp. TaxID=885 RepID=UPI0025C51D02|nr:7TM-DISM domain-containing protein [Desulfovibrio sp.]